MGFSLNCLLLSFLYLLIVKNNQASACTERLANAEPVLCPGLCPACQQSGFVALISTIGSYCIFYPKCQVTGEAIFQQSHHLHVLSFGLPRLEMEMTANHVNPLSAVA